MQIIIIPIIKVIYGIRKLSKNPKDFEVMYSPLNKYASHPPAQLASLAYCWKVGCPLYSSWWWYGYLRGSIVLDQALEAGGK